MLQLKMILRSWMRNPLSTVISVVSLTVGLVCSIMLMLFVIDEYRISNSVGSVDRVYLLEQPDAFYSDKSVKSSSTPPYLGWMLAERYPDIEKYASVAQIDIKHQGDDVISGGWSNIWSVTPNFADIFDIPVRQGDLKRTLTSEGEIAISDSYMQAIYGRNAVIGDRIKAVNRGSIWVKGAPEPPEPPEEHDWVITAILDDSRTILFQYGGLTSLPEQQQESMIKNKSYLGTWFSVIKLRPNSSIEDIQAKMAANNVGAFNNNNDVSFTPFEDVYFDSSERDRESFFIRRDPQLLLIGMLVALSVLLIAAFNYINITMTRACACLKNISGQLIFGATKWQVRRQTVLDTALLVIFSLGLSLLIISSLIEQFNAFMESNVALSDLLYWMNLASLGSLLLVLILLPSLYILVKIEVKRPMETFKNPMGRNIRISSVMVVAQFAISVVLIVFCMNITRQMYFITSQRPAANSILELGRGLLGAIPKDFKDHVITLVGVDNYSTEAPTPRRKVSVMGKSVNILGYSNQTLGFYEMKLLEGRMFAEQEASSNIIVNEALIRAFEIPLPAVNQTFDFDGEKLTIIGVVEDFLYEDAHKEIQSLIVDYKPYDESFWEIYLKVNGDVNQRIDEIQALWKDMYPDTPKLDIRTLAQIYKDMHKADQRMLTMVEIFMSISMFLTALGLFGLAFYTVARRSKEIALRKIHGSTTSQIILLLCRTFAIWVGIAFVIALPVAYYLSERWLAEFIYRVDIVWWVFAATGGVAVVVTFLTVIYQTWRAASANPAKSIKAE